MIDIKKELYHLCLEFVMQRIDAVSQAIAGAQEAANEETKSSSGDKYETGRAMMQQESEQNGTQLIEAKKLLTALKNIKPDGKSGQANTGSLVITNNGKFYIAVSAGALKLNGETYFAISPASPIGLKLAGQQTGYEFIQNGKPYRVLEVI
jgi:hypothetical protein